MLLIQCPAKAFNLFVSLSLSIYTYIYGPGCNTSNIMRHPFWLSNDMHLCITCTSPWTAFVHHLCLHRSPSNRHPHTSPVCQGTHAKLWSLSKRMGGPCFEANDRETARIGKVFMRAAGSCVLQWCKWGQFETATWTRNWFEAPINDSTFWGNWTFSITNIKKSNVAKDSPCINRKLVSKVAWWVWLQWQR